LAKRAKAPVEGNVQTLSPQWPADKIERRLVADLAPFANNPRFHSVEQIAQIEASIKEFGWTIPILLDERGEIIAGHGRVMAAKNLGITEVPCMVAVGWSEAQIRAYRIADNQLGNNSSWDNSLLKFEVGELRDFGFNTDILGLDSATLDSFFSSPDAPGSFKAVDENLETEHECPRCHYVWSGRSAPAAEAAE
jgi:ParB-like chromosome segregation protein Spo0J